jgi:hypothetical protein
MIKKQCDIKPSATVFGVLWPVSPASVIHVFISARCLLGVFYFYTYTHLVVQVMIDEKGTKIDVGKTGQDIKWH